MNTLEAERARRRRRLLGGLVLGVAAVGIPALANRWIASRAPRLRGPGWGRTQKFRWGRGEVAFRELGAGPPVVFLHGFGIGRDGEEWRLVAERIATAGFRAFVPDLPGWGLSTDPRLNVRAELYAAFVRDFLVDVVREPAVVVAAGHTATAAAHASLEAGVEVAGLALVCPRGLGNTDGPPTVADRLLRLALPLPILGESALNAVTARPTIARALARDLYAAPERVDAQVVDRAYRAAHAPGAQRALGALFAGRLDEDASDLVGRVTVPTLLLWGRLARDPSVELADPWLAHLAESSVEVFESSRLLPHVEEAPAFARRLVDFAGACLAETAD
jgi:pimeloyl-ACP methyl ester carboxylesterase